MLCVDFNFGQLSEIVPRDSTSINQLLPTPLSSSTNPTESLNPKLHEALAHPTGTALLAWDVTRRKAGLNAILFGLVVKVLLRAYVGLCSPGAIGRKRVLH